MEPGIVQRMREICLVGKVGQIAESIQNLKEAINLDTARN